MSERNEMEPARETQPAQTETATNINGLRGVERIYQTGGYFTGLVGWPGLVSWLMRKLLDSMLGGLILVAIAVGWIVMDETIRTKVRQLLEVAEPETRVAAENVMKFEIREGADFQKLSTRWKQLLAEVQLNQSEYSPRFVRMLSELTLADIEKIDRVAPYVVGGAILRNSEENSGHDMPGLNYVDLARLRGVGILEQGQLGQKANVAPENGQPASQVLYGTSLALRVTASDASTEISIPLTLLTEEGNLIVELLDRATSLAGMCTGASRFDPEKFATQIWARFEPSKKPWFDPAEMHEITSLCEPS